MKKVIKKVVAKAPVKKTVAKKPMMKSGGAKKSLPKAQYGNRVFSGPLNKSDIERLDRAYPSTASVTIPQAPKEADLIRGLNPFVNGQMVSNEEREAMDRKKDENYMRSKRFKKGGSVKSTTRKSLIKAQDGKIIKSKKVRTADINDSGPSSASVSRTNRKGTTVTKSINTDQGYVPTASKTKTTTDSKGNTTSTTKDMSWNKALKKQERITKKIGRNPNDEMRGEMYKKGGAVKKVTAKKVMVKSGGAKKPLRKAQDGMFSGPMTESKQKYMDKAKADAASAQNANIIYGPQGEFNRAYSSDMADIKQKENQARAYQKKGGTVKSKAKKMADGGPTYSKTNRSGNSKTISEDKFDRMYNRFNGRTGTKFEPKATVISKSNRSGTKTVSASLPREKKGGTTKSKKK